MGLQMQDFLQLGTHFPLQSKSLLQNVNRSSETPPSTIENGKPAPNNVNWSVFEMSAGRVWDMDLLSQTRQFKLTLSDFFYSITPLTTKTLSELYHLPNLISVRTLLVTSQILLIKVDKMRNIFGVSVNIV